MKVAILGASGGMGTFFARYFLEKGNYVSGSDPEDRRARGVRVELHRTNAEAVRGCDLAVLAVPMEETVKVAREVAPRMRTGSTLLEISSVKGETLGALRRAAGKRVALLSVHPLFGPALASTEGMKVAVIVAKVRKGREEPEAAMVRKIFPEARVIPMTRAQHDRCMAVVLSLTHILNIVYAGTAARFLTTEEFSRVSTPNSSMQMTLAEAVLAQDPRLSFAIQSKNGYTGKVAREAARELQKAIATVERSDWRGFDAQFGRLARRYASGRRARAAVREVYSAIEGEG